MFSNLERNKKDFGASQRRALEQIYGMYNNIYMDNLRITRERLKPDRDARKRADAFLYDMLGLLHDGEVGVKNRGDFKRRIKELVTPDAYDRKTVPLELRLTDAQYAKALKILDLYGSKANLNVKQIALVNKAFSGIIESDMKVMTAKRGYVTTVGGGYILSLIHI